MAQAHSNKRTARNDKGKDWGFGHDGPRMYVSI